MQTKVGNIEVLEKKINSRIAEFDVLALLRILKFEGYNECQVLFHSFENMASQSSLISHVNLKDDRVEIYINAGLLSTQSPLPGYFFRKMENESINTELMETFFRYFDHLLILDYLRNTYPEINEYFFREWELTKYYYVVLQNMRSIQSLHWLFQLVYPELQVQIEKKEITESKKTSQMLLGDIVLGEVSSIGGVKKYPIPGVRILLIYDCEYWMDFQLLPDEIRQRLKELVFPFLNKIEMYLEINLDIFITDKWLKLYNQSNLGYDHFFGGDTRNRRVRIFKGYVPYDTDYSYMERELNSCKIRV